MNWLLCPLPNWSFESWYLKGEHVCAYSRHYFWIICAVNEFVSWIFTTFEIFGHGFPEKYQIFGEIFVSSNNQLGKGHNSQFIVFTDYCTIFC